jgi:hypothetical protein
MSQSKGLTEFYNAYNDWVNTGAPECNVFSRSYGLCLNLRVYGDSLNLCNEMKAQFVEAELSCDYPFNESENEYFVECDAGEAALNPERIKWVQEHLS